MKLLTIGDTHFSHNNSDDTNALHEKTLALIEDRKIDVVVVMGDIMHTHGTTKIDVFNRSCAYLRDITKKVGRNNTFVLIGNHDRVNNKVGVGEEHFFASLKKCKEYPIFIDEAKIVDILGFKLCMVQYMPPSTLISHLNEVVENIEEIDCFFMHQELRGCKIGLETSKIGDEWKEEWPQVISGHIHEYHKYKNITYVGTPYQVHFGSNNENEDKTVSVWDFTRNEETEKCMMKEKRVRLKIASKLTLTMNVKEWESYKPPYQSWVKYKINDSKESINLMKETKKYKLESKNSKIKFMFVINGGYELKYNGCSWKNIDANKPFKDWIKISLNEIDEDMRNVFETI